MAVDEGKGYGLCFRHRLLSVGVNIASLKAQNAYHKTGNEIGKEMRGDFKKRKGYDPEPAGDKHRWF